MGISAGFGRLGVGCRPRKRVGRNRRAKNSSLRPGSDPRPCECRRSGSPANQGRRGRTLPTPSKGRHSNRAADDDDDDSGDDGDDEPADQRSPYPDDSFLTDRRIARRYSVSVRSVKRWQRDEALGFPQPDMVVNGRNFTKLSRLEAWERRPEQRRAQTTRPPGLL
jgi:hypothetical protein